MDKYTVNTLFVFFTIGQQHFMQTICRNIWLTVAMFLIMIGFTIYAIVKIECKRDYGAVALGLIAIASVVFGLIMYN